jgi:hypothetical protein
LQQRQTLFRISACAASIAAFIERGGLGSYAADYMVGLHEAAELDRIFLDWSVYRV